MQPGTSHSSDKSFRRRKSKEHKKTENYVYYLFRNAGDERPWARAEKMRLSISEDHLQKELARSHEAGKDVASVMCTLPAAKQKLINKLHSEMNEQEQSSRYEWQIISIGQEKPLPEFGNISQTMWTVLKRERKEKKERTHKSSSRHSRPNNERREMTHEELQQLFTQQYIPSQYQNNQSSSYVQPGDVSVVSYSPAQPAIQEATSTPSVGGSCSPAISYIDSYASSNSSTDTTDTESQSSGYSSEAESISSNLTTGSTASSSSSSSIVTPPLQRVPLRGILRKTNPSSAGVTIHSDSASDISNSSEQDCQAVCYNSVTPNPFARMYIGTAPHAKKEFRRARKSGRLSEHQLDTASTTTSSSTIRRTRFSDEASFCIAYHCYDSAEESEAEIQYQERDDSRMCRRRSAEPGALAISKYVMYGSD